MVWACVGLALLGSNAPKEVISALFCVFLYSLLNKELSQKFRSEEYFENVPEYLCLVGSFEHHGMRNDLFRKTLNV